MRGKKFTSVTDTAEIVGERIDRNGRAERRNNWIGQLNEISVERKTGQGVVGQRTSGWGGISRRRESNRGVDEEMVNDSVANSIVIDV